MLTSTQPIPVAQYLRMSTEHQNFSLENQSTALAHYAAQNNFIVVRTYVDSGKSGVVLKHREGLAQLLHDVLKGGQPYKAILVYDVSRWGRFMDADEAAYYEFLCKRTGIPIHYCAESFPNDSTMPGAIMKALKRAMAAEYSRDLSNRVYEGLTRLVGRGLWTGSTPGYGLRRMLISSDGKQKQVLQDKENKNIRSDHTILVPGPPDEVACVREIFRLYVKEGRSAPYIANKLNEQGIMRGGSKWNNQYILKILKHDKYVGSLVWGRSTRKLYSRCVSVPKDKWVVKRGAFEPIVDVATFEAVRKTLAQRTQNVSSDKLLKRVRALLNSKGRLSTTILERSRTAPSPICCIHRFGSLEHMYDLLGYKREDTVLLRSRTRALIANLHQRLAKRLKETFPNEIFKVNRHKKTRPTMFRFSSGLKFGLAVCMSEKTCLGSRRWRFQSRSALRRGLITLLCRCNMDNTGFCDFFVLPNVENLGILSLLREDDERLSKGIKLRGLSQFSRVAHSMAGFR